MMNPSLWFFSPRKKIYRVGVEVGVAPGGHEVGGAPPPSWTGGGPPGLHLLQGFFYYFQIDVPWSFRSFREILFLHKNNTMAILLKTASVRVSSIQIMQVRVQNKGKSVWKSIYVGDVSGSPILLRQRIGQNSLLWLAKRSWGYTGFSSSHFHHVGLICVRYFDNLICGWTGA